MNYNYWNDFIKDWSTTPISRYNSFPPINDQILQWEHPNNQPLINNPGLSFEFLPEPWWGNNGSDELHSVVVNFNPGKGGGWQHYLNSITTFRHTSYSDFMFSELTSSIKNLPLTSKWHLNKRAKPIFNALSDNGIIMFNSTLKNHLSIELIPWHTENINMLQPYVLRNAHEIFTNSFMFAADQSKRIANKILKNKVIVRMSKNFILPILDSIQNHGISKYKIIGNCGYFNENSAVMKFHFSEIENVEFICVWGRYTRNDFPKSVDMNLIFKNINNLDLLFN
jgi:hypothetical protein